MPRILIIDDDPTVLLGTELLLGTLGFETEIANNGEDGLASLRAQPPDLVVCDIVMPGLDGFGVLAAAQQEPRLARVPFIFLTSQADRQTHRRGMAAGADDFLTKPFHPSELVDAIQACFRKRVAHGPDQAAMAAALVRLRRLLSRPEQERLGLAEPHPSAPPPAPLPPRVEISPAQRRAEYWIGRVRSFFDDNNPQAILYLQDRVISKKQTIHATYLLAKLLFETGHKAQAEAEFAISVSVLNVNMELFRTALLADSRPGMPGSYQGLRPRIMRLEDNLEALRQKWLV